MAARTGNALGFASFASLLQWAHARAGSIPHTAARANAPWRKVFQAAGMIQLIPLLMLAYVSGREGGAGGHESVARTRPRPPRRDASASATSSPVAHPSLAILRELSRRPEFWLHSIFRSCIMVLVSFLLFVPSYMAQCYGMSSAGSARVGSLFALGCLLAVSTLAEWTYPPVAAMSSATSIESSYRRRAYFMLAFLAIATMCLMFQTAFLRVVIHLTPLLGSLLMFLFGFSLGKARSNGAILF